MFQLAITDYRGWAHGLKQAGYATNPVYANSLIDIIELYRLYEYDTMKPNKNDDFVPNDKLTRKEDIDMRTRQSELQRQLLSYSACRRNIPKHCKRNWYKSPQTGKI